MRRRLARRRRWGLALLGVLFLGSPACGTGAGAGELLRVRCWPWDDRFRVVLDLSAATLHVDRVVTDPDRIAINLRDTRAAGVTLPATEDWMVERIRLNRLRSGTAQIVLDLVQSPSFKIFELPPGDGRPYRIVCDVFRPREPQARDGATPWVVVIDPGHGGHDPGTVFRRLKEKEIVLDVARRLAEALSRESGVIAHLTRRNDTFINLAERLERAEAVDADVFVSIHANGFRSAAVRGAEVYFLSLRGGTDAAARELAVLENAAVADAPDPVIDELPELPFAVDLLTTDTIRRSSLLAEAILDQLVAQRLAASRGVRQANFVVLRSCRVPSALVELGYISNPDDARRLSSPDHRQALAEAIADGLLTFRNRFGRQSLTAEPTPAAGAPATSAP